MVIPALILALVLTPASAPSNPKTGPKAGPTAVSETPHAATSPLASDAAAADAGDAAYAEQAPLDVETLLGDPDKEYLRARARLVAHPALAAEALLDRLAAVPAPGPAHRKRLMDVLAELRDPAHVDLFAAELRRAVLDAPSRRKASLAVDLYSPMLVDQGAAAAPALQKLVGDRDLPMQVRATLLDDLVEVTPDERLADLVVLVGRGHRDLSGQLRRSMSRRTGKSATARAAVVAATDAALDRALASPPDPAEAQRLPGLLTFRGAVGHGSDPAFVERLVAIAQSPDARFGARVAAIRGLSSRDDPAGREALERLATSELDGPRRRTQAGEILGWLALSGLPAARATPLADRLHLVDDEAPRLAALGYALASLGPDQTWLPASQSNPWPQVRHSALDRVESPCNGEVLRHLARVAGPVDDGGDGELIVARAAVAAVGRCGGGHSIRTLAGLMKDKDVNVEIRAEAARQLVRRGGPAGIDAVADLLDDGPPRMLARRLAAALRHAPAPTPRATEVLCATVAEHGDAARPAAQSLLQLHGTRTACDGV